MGSNQKCDDCWCYVIPGQGKWIGNRRIHCNASLCEKAKKRTTAMAEVLRRHKLASSAAEQQTTEHASNTIPCLS